MLVSSTIPSINTRLKKNSNDWTETKDLLTVIYNLKHNGKHMHQNMAASCTYHLQLSSSHCSTRAISKKHYSKKKVWECSGKKCQRNRPLAEKWRDRKGKRTRQTNKRWDRKGVSNDRLRLKTWRGWGGEGGHKTSPPPFGIIDTKNASWQVKREKK